MLAEHWPTGPQMKRALQSAGIHPQKVVRRQATSEYVAEFYQTDMQADIAPARVWAREIEMRLRGATILRVQDTVADWRPGRPVISATVIFSLGMNRAMMRPSHR